MNEYRKIGIFLNGEPGDDEALNYGGRFAQLADVDAVVCIHVPGIEDRSIDDRPDEDELRRHVLAQLPEAFAEKTRVVVSAGSGVREVLRATRDEALDLIVVGRRLPHVQAAAGSTFARLGRKAPCSVLVVPEKARTHFGRLLVLVDFSAHSKRGLQIALGMARASAEPKPQVVVLTVYTVNYGYRYTGQTLDEAARNLEKIWHVKMDEFLEGVDTTGVDLEVIHEWSRSIEAAAFDIANARNMDMIVLGSRGAGAYMSGFLGPTAERVLHLAPLPVFIVKKKGETVRFLDVLLGD